MNHYRGELLASNCTVLIPGRMLGLSRAHTRSKGHSNAVQSTESTLLLEIIKVLIYIMVANLYMIQNTEGNKAYT